MSFVRIWVHIVFSTKNREPLLTCEVKSKVCKHIMKNCSEKNIFLQSINGYLDHLHCLISLGKEQNVAKVCQLIKGESSYWINQNRLVEEQFLWQDDYWAVSVSESQVDRVMEYINNQEIHHQNKSFEEEMNYFWKKYENKNN
jgi:putative transposase